MSLLDFFSEIILGARLAYMVDDDDDPEVKTPKTTGSFAVFHEESRRLAGRFRDIVALKSRSLPTLDIRGARNAQRLAEELDRMAERFAQWPMMSDEEIALDRQVRVSRLMDLNRICEEIWVPLQAKAKR